MRLASCATLRLHPRLAVRPSLLPSTLHTSERRRLSSSTKWTPRTLLTHLDSYVVGQHSAKKALSVAVYNHVLRVQQLELQAAERAGVDAAAAAAEERAAESLGRASSKAATAAAATSSSSATSPTAAFAAASESEAAILSDWSGQVQGNRLDDHGFPYVPLPPSSSAVSPPSSAEQGKPKSVKNVKAKRKPVAAASTRDGLTTPHLVRPIETPPPLPKTNVLLLGPSGSGKSLLLQTLAKALGLPFLHVDATPLTQAGYVGEDAENIVARLLSVAGGDAALAGRGVVVIDEVDKLARRPGDQISKDVSGEGVQQALLRILEGAVIQVPADKVQKNAAAGVGATASAAAAASATTPNGKAAPWWPTGQAPSGRLSMLTGPSSKTPTATLVDTSGVLFVLCGAFIGLGDVVRKRLLAAADGAEDEIPDDDAAYAMAEPGDLTAYGLIPEFVGRVPVLASLGALSQEELLRVLTEPKDSLVSSYTSLFAAYHIELRITTLALRSLASQATARRTGARSLRRLMELRLRDAMFDAPGGDTRYALLDEKAAKGQADVRLFALGEKYRWESAWEEEQLASLRTSDAARTGQSIMSADRGPGMGIEKKTKQFKQTGLHGAGSASPPSGKGKETGAGAAQRRNKKTWGPWYRGEPDESAVRKWNRARLVRPSRVGNLRIVADDKPWDR